MKQLPLFLLLTALGFGCGPKMASSVNIDERIAPDSRIAVLPFENLSGRENAGEKLTDYVSLSLQTYKRVTIAEFGQTYESMRRNRVRSSAYLTDSQIDSLAANLSVAYLLTGSVIELNETDNQYLGKVPQVSLNVRLIKCSGHRTVWSGSVNARGDQSEFVFGIGAVRSKDELAQKVAAKVAGRINGMVGK